MDWWRVGGHVTGAFVFGGLYLTAVMMIGGMVVDSADFSIPIILLIGIGGVVIERRLYPISNRDYTDMCRLRHQTSRKTGNSTALWRFNMTGAFERASPVTPSQL